MYTLLGPNRPWRTLLRQHGPRGLARRGLAVVTTLLSLLLLQEMLTPTQSMGAVVMLMSLGVFQLVRTR